jgi:hypothetical protein
VKPLDTSSAGKKVGVGNQVIHGVEFHCAMQHRVLICGQSMCMCASAITTHMLVLHNTTRGYSLRHEHCSRHLVCCVVWEGYVGVSIAYM